MSCKRSVKDTYLSPAEKPLAASETFWIDYTDELADMTPTDTIAASTWAITGSVTEAAKGFNTTGTWIRLAGGTKIGTLHRCVNTVTTANGDTLIRTLTVKIVNVHAQRPERDNYEADVTYSTPTPV